MIVSTIKLHKKSQKRGEYFIYNLFKYIMETFRIRLVHSNKSFDHQKEICAHGRPVSQLFLLLVFHWPKTSVVDVRVNHVVD